MKKELILIQPAFKVFVRATATSWVITFAMLLAAFLLLSAEVFEKTATGIGFGFILVLLIFFSLEIAVVSLIQPVTILTKLFRTRYTDWELTLPVSGKEHFAAKMLSFALVCLIFPILSVAPFWFTLPQVDRVEELFPKLLQVNVFTYFLVVLFHILYPTRSRPAGRALPWGFLVAEVVMINLTINNILLPVWGCLAVLAVTLALVVWGYSKIPDAIQLFVDAGSSRKEKDIEENESFRSPSSSLRNWVLKTALLNWITILYVFFTGVIAAGIAEEHWTSIEGLFGFDFINKWYSFFICLVLGGFSTVVSYKLLVNFSSLPLSKKKLFALICLPFLSALFAGWSIRFLVSEAKPSLQESHIYWGLDHGRVYQNLPSALHKLSFKEEIPVIVSPSGETYRPKAQPAFGIWDHIPLCDYNPYEIGPDSSLAFARFQFARMLKDVWEIEVDEAELEALSSSAISKSPNWLQNIVDKYPEKIEQTQRQGYFAGLLLAIFSWMLVQYFSSSNLPPASKKLNWFRFGMYVLALPLCVLLWKLYRLEFFALLKGVIFHLQETPLLAWPGLLAAFGAIYFICQRHFEKMEVPVGFNKAWLFMQSSGQRSTKD